MGIFRRRILQYIRLLVYALGICIGVYTYLKYSKDSKDRASFDTIFKSLENITAVNEVDIISKKLEQNISSIPSHCSCKSKHFKEPEIYVSELNKAEPYMNLTVIEHLKKHHPNFPYTIILSILNKTPLNAAKFCDLLPYPHSINWHNKHWQQLKMDQENHYLLYSAYIDNRPSIDPRPCIRILTLSKNLNPDTPWCYLWFGPSEPPVLSKAVKIEYIDYQAKSPTRYMAFIITCPLPPEAPQEKPQAVSLVAAPCDEASNLMEVIGAMERNPSKAYRNGIGPVNGTSNKGFNFAVCGTALFYYLEDFSTRLVEWLEILRSMGFSHVFLHETDVHPNVKKVLIHYENIGFIQVTHFSYPDPYVNEPTIRRLWYLMEDLEMSVYALNKIYFNDCLLRYMHEYRFIGHFDPDEIPMFPPNFDSFVTWMESIFDKVVTSGKSKPVPDGYFLRWQYHVGDLEAPEEAQDLPVYLWSLRHTKIPKKWVKGHRNNGHCIFDMDTVTGVSSHRIMTCSTDECYRYEIPIEDGYLGHFKNECGSQCKNNNYKEVKTLLQYKDQVNRSVTQVLKELKII